MVFLPTSHPSEDARMARRQQNRSAQDSAVGRKILDRASKSVTQCNVDSPETLIWANCKDGTIGTNEKTCKILVWPSGVTVVNQSKCGSGRTSISSLGSFRSFVPSDRFCKPLFEEVSSFGCLFCFCVYWTVNNFIASQTQSKYSWSRDQIEPACSQLNWTLEPACSSIEPACSPWLWSYWTERLTGQRAFTKKISIPISG